MDMLLLNVFAALLFLFFFIIMFPLSLGVLFWMCVLTLAAFVEDDKDFVGLLFICFVGVLAANVILEFDLINENDVF